MFAVDEDETGRPLPVEDSPPGRYPFRTGAELLAHTRETGLRVSDVMLANELSWRTESEIRAGLLKIWAAMQECVERGTHTVGVLPGGMKVRRRAAALRTELEGARDDADPLRAMDWVTLHALAVNEENAAGDFVDSCSDDGVVRFLLTAAAIGMTEVLGGTPEQVENAAEIGIEHNLGLACDPIGGLVQIPCIERNAIGSVKAIGLALNIVEC